MRPHRLKAMLVARQQHGHHPGHHPGQHGAHQNAHHTASQVLLLVLGIALTAAGLVAVALHARLS